MRQVSIGHRSGILLVFLVAVWALSQSGISVAWAQRQNPPAKVLAYPDMIFYNGKVLTADDQFTIAEAVAIRDGKFLEVGKNNDVLELAGPNTRKIDLKGKTVTPGFVMHHLHLPDYAHYAMLREDLLERAVPLGGHWYPGQDKIVWENTDQMLRDLKKAVDVSKPGEWVSNVAAQDSWSAIARLKRSELDAISAGHALILLSPFGSVYAANTLALKLANISPDQYPKGDVARTGEELSWPLIQAERWAFIDRLETALKKKIAEYNKDGLTTLAGTRTMPADVTALRELWVKGELTMRYRVALRVLEADPNPEKTLRQLGNLSDIGDDMFRISGMNMGASDGGTEGGGAWTYEPKLHELPGNPSQPYGPRPPNEPWPDHEQTVLVIKYGWSTAQSHSAGDRGTSAFLDAYEEGKKNRIVKSSNQRLAIDHLVIVRPQDIKRFKELGVQPSISPWFLFKKEENLKAAQQYGFEKMSQWMPAKSYIDLGLRPDIEGDINGEPYRSPLWSIEKFVNRKDDNGKVWNLKEKVTRQQGLWMLTNWAANYTGEEKKLGTIEPGKLADLVVLEKDYMTVPEDEISKIPVLMTVVGGKVVHQIPERF